MDYKQEIKERGLKLKFVADRVGISQPELSMFINKTRNMPDEVEVRIKEIISQIPKLQPVG